MARRKRRVAQFEKHMRAAEGLRPMEVRASATRYRQLADAVLDHFRELKMIADDCETDMPERLGELRQRAEHMRGHAATLFAFADRAEETRAIAARLRGVSAQRLDERDQQELERSLRLLYERLPEGGTS